MWLSVSLSALWLAAGVLAGVHDQTTTDADGIRSIPVCLSSSSARRQLLTSDSCGRILWPRFVDLQQMHPLT
jgi:hypothetical protein